MKILLFNLGTIEHRILSWEVEGFRSLFEQDIILWGPVPDKQFVFDGKEIPILRVFEQTSVGSLFDQLPEGWYPDIVTCDTSALNYIADIYNCPVKTILFPRDSWSDTIFNRGLVEFFDFLSSSTIDRSLYSDYHVRILPLNGFAVSTPGSDSINSEFEQRDIDVLAIANYDNSFYHERHKIFYKLSAASNKDNFKINFVRSVKRSGIYSYYQRSKIVLDWAHTLSNRSYEAALNGCLLFSHEDNKVMSEFWVPWEEYIPYHENNLPDLIGYYLHNPDLAKKVVANAQKKIKTAPATWGDMVWERIKEVYKSEISVKERIDFNNSLTESIVHYRTSTPLLYNYDYEKNFPLNWKELYFQRIEKSLSAAANNDEKVLPLIEASRLAFLLKNEEAALGYLNELHKIVPDYAWTHYLIARIYYARGNYPDALTTAGKALRSAQIAPELLRQYVLPIIEKGNTCDGRRVTDYMWQSIYNNKNEFQIRALIHLTFELTGLIYQKTGDTVRALDAYLQAIECIPIPECFYRTAQLLNDKKDGMKLLEICAKCKEDSPYDTIIILYEALALVSLNRKRQAYEILNCHRRALNNFKGSRKNTKIRYYISLILLLVTLNNSVGSVALAELITKLRKRTGTDYIS